MIHPKLRINVVTDTMSSRFRSSFLQRDILRSKSRAIRWCLVAEHSNAPAIYIGGPSLLPPRDAAAKHSPTWDEASPGVAEQDNGGTSQEYLIG